MASLFIMQERRKSPAQGKAPLLQTAVIDGDQHVPAIMNVVWQPVGFRCGHVGKELPTIPHRIGIIAYHGNKRGADFCRIMKL